MLLTEPAEVTEISELRRRAQAKAAEATANVSKIDAEFAHQLEQLASERDPVRKVRALKTLELALREFGAPTLLADQIEAELIYEMQMANAPVNEAAAGVMAAYLYGFERIGPDVATGEVMALAEFIASDAKFPAKVRRVFIDRCNELLDQAQMEAPLRQRVKQGLYDAGRPNFGLEVEEILHEAENQRFPKEMEQEVLRALRFLTFSPPAEMPETVFAPITKAAVQYRESTQLQQAAIMAFVSFAENSRYGAVTRGAAASSLAKLMSAIRETPPIHVSFITAAARLLNQEDKAPLVWLSLEVLHRPKFPMDLQRKAVDVLKKLDVKRADPRIKDELTILLAERHFPDSMRAQLISIHDQLGQAQ